MNTNNSNVYFDVDIKKCDITKPHEALVSDFSKKLIAHVSSKSSQFKENYITDIVAILEDENETLSTIEGSDFLQFMDENKNFFDEMIKKYKGYFPARVQSLVSSDSMDMKQEDSVLYENGRYISLDKVKAYVQTRTKRKHEKGVERVEATDNILRSGERIPPVKLSNKEIDEIVKNVREIQDHIAEQGNVSEEDLKSRITI